MEIGRIGVEWVRLPLRMATRAAHADHRHALRVLVTVETADGGRGTAETHAVADATRLAAVAEHALRGVDARHGRELHARLDRCGGLYETMIPAGLRAGIEIACLDAVGRAEGRPVWSLLGGRARATVPAAAYILPGVDDPDDPTAYRDAILERADRLVAEYGFGTLKLKGGVRPIAKEAEILRALHERHPAAPLRWDPNAAWDVGGALEAVRRVERLGVDLELLEDPVAGLTAMAAVRARTSVPIGTNMCVVAPEHIGPAIALRAVDLVLADPHYWGGFAPNLELAAACRHAGIDVGMHSDNDLGLATAAKVHLAAVIPELRTAIDTHHPQHPDDLLVAPVPFADGAFSVPDGPGLGVELDPERVARYRIDEREV